MPTYKGGTSLQAPLRLQLRVPAGQVARLYAIHAAGDTDAGSASRPAITRPGVLGTGNSLTATPLHVATPARCTLSDSFSVAPSLPSLSMGAFALPIIIDWEAPRGAGIIAGSQNADSGLLLFSNATGGHSWTATFTWEEL